MKFIAGEENKEILFKVFSLMIWNKLIQSCVFVLIFLDFFLCVDDKHRDTLINWNRIDSKQKEDKFVLVIF